ncbi:cytochrome P450 3A19-like [Culex pipiens pallens]|uniref:cytochrome P450 3A19-like n=1 Tax=Culex pipiens pallens TaxID=42434 RepID=UPI0022AA9F3C|nr:cytochrome P450 3A19-like [Culex pipiens pallens]
MYQMTSGYQEENKQFNIFQQLPKEVKAMMTERQQQFPKDITSPHFIDRVFQLSKDSTDPEAIQDHLETIIFAGSETTATTLATTLLMLAINRDVQEKVFQEINTVCPNPFEREFIDQGALSRLVYTEQVVKETMRLFPIGPIVARKVTGDVRLTQVTVPAGANVAIPIFKLQRNPEYWGSDAEAFDPERFSPERTARRHPYCYIPFTAGLRNCVGIRYSWQLMKVALVHLLWRFRFSSELAMEDLQLKLSMVLRIENGSVLRIERR